MLKPLNDLLPLLRSTSLGHLTRKLGKTLLLGFVGLTIVLTVVFHQQTVHAQSTSMEVATGSNWQGASFPVENFQEYTSPFGYRQSATGGDGWEFHRGLDMAAPIGSFIRNWWTGVVTEVSDNTNCGTMVVIQSGQWEHIYCHMMGYASREAGQNLLIEPESGLRIWEGQVIPAGARIGRVGMTGRTTGPHLHWGLKFTGQWVDPALVLRAMYSQQSGA